ncbi:hypothetical protein niasHT_032298 [Heterodera trifolii]|uniref:Flavin-containing monooxygenase n=1 Tax=Heterodera trifolii TaxID=157864 RepID=A0ABD2I2Z0_9BILA
MKVCIIRACVNGLTAIKACIEEGITDIVCYEKTSQIGGLWNYRPDKVECATVMASTVINTSKEMMAYSDFPPPIEFPNFMHHSYVQKYVEMYADHFNLAQYIEFNTEVKEMTLNNNGIWQVQLSVGQLRQFDAAMICTGHHCEPLVPQITGLENFKGQILHAKQYRDYKGFEDKNVFIVGIGNSALDIGPSNYVAKRLAIIGLVQPIGSVAPIAEMQSRWAAAVFAGRLQLPDIGTMCEDIAQTRAQMCRQYFESAKHTVQVPFIPYMDELAELVGCKPNLAKLFMDDPKFALRLFFGPNVPYVYRISGLNRWVKAKIAINSLPRRVKMPLKQCGGPTREMPTRNCKGLPSSKVGFQGRVCRFART